MADSSTSSKTLSYYAIVVIAANTMNGPGLTTLPCMANSAGNIIFTFFTLLAACVTAYVLHSLCRTIWTPNTPSSSSPSSEEKTIVSLSETLLNQKQSSSWIMVGCAICLALAQMMLCAAIADCMYVATLGKSCGMSFTGFYCTSDLDMKPFQHSSTLIKLEKGVWVNTRENPPMSFLSMGLITASMITVSLASVDQSGMITAQYVLFVCLLIASCRFCWTLIHMEALDDNVTPKEPLDAVGPILFNFAFVVTAPPLASGAANGVTATLALGASCFIMGLLYIIIGCLGSGAASAALAKNQDENLLSLVLKGVNGSTTRADLLDIIAVSLFGLSQLAAIPVYCELARDTLLNHIGIHSNTMAFITGHILPWLICAITYNSSLFESFVDWSSLLLLGFSNFSFPLLLDYIYITSIPALSFEKGTGPYAILWTFCLVTAAISAVIAQRISHSAILAAGTFVVTIMIALLSLVSYIHIPSSSTIKNIENESTPYHGAPLEITKDNDKQIV